MDLLIRPAFIVLCLYSKILSTLTFSSLLSPPRPVVSGCLLHSRLSSLPLAVTALLVSTAIVLLLSSTPSQHGIPTLDLPRVQASTAVQTSAPVQTDAPEPSDLHRAASDAGALTELQSRRSPHPDSIKPTYPNQDEPEDSETDPWLESLCLGKQNKGCDPDPNAGNRLRSGSEGKGRVGGVGGVQWVEPVGDEPQSEIEAIWAAHAAKHMTFGKVQQPRRPAEAREEVREEALEEAGDKVRHHDWSEGRGESMEIGGMEGIPEGTSLQQEKEEEQEQAEQGQKRKEEEQEEKGDETQEGEEGGDTEREQKEPWRISSFSTHIGLSRDIRLSSSTVHRRKTPPPASAKKIPASPPFPAPSPSLPPAPSPPSFPSPSSPTPQPEATSAPSAEPSPQSPSTPRAKLIVRTKTWQTWWAAAEGVNWEGHVACRIIVRTKTWGTWWAAADGVNWEGRVGRVYSTPSASQALTIIRVSDTEMGSAPRPVLHRRSLTIIRVSDNEFQFLTPSNTFLTKAPSMFLETTTNSSDPLTVFTIEYIPDTVYVFQFLTPSNTFLTKAPSMFLETTTNSSDPLTVFTIEYIPDTVYIVFKSSDGWYISQNGESGPQFWWQGEPGDWERLDVREIMWVPAIRGANLGSWLMTEPWMNREVFKFAGYGDGTRMYCNGSLNKDAYLHLTTVRNASSNTRRIAVQWLQYWAVRKNSPNVWVQSTEPEVIASNFELFIFGIPLNESTEQRGSSVRVVLRAPNGLFVQANPDGSLTADLIDSLDNDAIWSSAAAFDLTVVSVTSFPSSSLPSHLLPSLWRVEADWQAAYTVGAAAPSIYENIRRNFITEADWQKMQELGINTVRIPLGYWIALDASPEFPFVPGAATYLDWAFEMGRKYGVRIWFSVHVAPGSQAGKGNARDGLIRWRGANINRTLDFVTWLADRYATDPMWLGMGLLNEPVVPGANGYAGVDLEDMRGYYSAAFNAIRARCLCCFVAMEGRVGSNFGDVMWHMSDAWHNNMILEQHIYEVFGNFFSSQGVNFELDYAYTTRVNNIVSFQEKVGRQLLVGEFCNAMGNPATPEQQANFSLGQMKAFSHAKAGWFFWSWKLNTTDFRY
ncbi:unnamed protein product [Closterium sp. NIES-65]|nr:unnamed protein product [Closterium sp. NIES-65]